MTQAFERCVIVAAMAGTLIACNKPDTDSTAVVAPPAASFQ